MNYSNLTISELDNASVNSQDNLVAALNSKLQALVDAIDFLNCPDFDEAETASNIEYIKKLAGLANNY